MDGWYWQYYAGGSWGSYDVQEDWGKVTWDEAWVNAAGESDGVSPGWLGAPLSDYENWLVAPGTELLYTAYGDTAFDRAGSVGSWPSPFAYRRDTTGGTVTIENGGWNGSGQAIVCSTTVASPSANYNVAFRGRGNASLSVGARDAITLVFWAKSTTPNRFFLGLRDSSTGSPTTNGSHIIWTDGTWRQYAVILHNNSGSAQTDVQVAFYMADTTGRWWFDRITAYSGSKVVYTRKFDNGIVIVNPTGTNQSIVLPADGRDYKRLLGFTNPYTTPSTASRTDANWANDGTVETDRAFTVGPVDAVFLMSRPTDGWTATTLTPKRKWWEWWFRRPSAAPTPSQ